MSNMSILDAVKKLTATFPLNPENVGASLGATLERNPKGDSPAVEAWSLASGPAGTVTAVDLRMPDDDIGDGKAFLSLDVGDGAGVAQADILKHFGLDFQSLPPSPKYPVGAVPLYLVYQQDWGKLSFGVTPDETGRLVRIVIESN